MHRVLLSARQPAQAEPAPEDVAFHPARVGQALRDLRRTAASGVKLPARVFACGFSLNKRRILRRFAGDSIVHCVRHARRIPPGSTLLLWGSTAAPPGLTADVALIRVEDGFLRSVGLGAELARPVSWVMDRTGIYYDATRPSDLEQLLQSCEFTPQLLARAAALRERIVTSGITKYSVGERAWRRPARGEGERQVRDWCDEVLTEVAMGRLLEQVDEVHVLTSLAGFEALMRGKFV